MKGGVIWAMTKGCCMLAHLMHAPAAQLGHLMAGLHAGWHRPCSWDRFVWHYCSNCRAASNC